MTKEEAIKAGERYRTTIYHVTEKAGDGTPKKVRVNGKCQTWKTRPKDFRLPVKYGLSICGYIDQDNAKCWTLTDPTTKGQTPCMK
jgi:hypothetical protein